MYNIIILLIYEQNAAYKVLCEFKAIKDKPSINIYIYTIFIVDNSLYEQAMKYYHNNKYMYSNIFYI